MVQEVFAGDRIAVGARGSSGASSSKGAADFRFTLGSGLPGMILQHKSCQFPAVNNRKPELTQKAFWLSPIYLAARSTISATTVRANQFPRAVSRAEALPWSTLSVSNPSRPRSATVTPEMGLSQVLADGAIQTPHRL
jgi:hypothetical protein